METTCINTSGKYHLFSIPGLFTIFESKFKDADQYLEIAFGTAKAYYTYPTELLGDYYEPFKWGCYNKLVITDLTIS